MYTSLSQQMGCITPDVLRQAHCARLVRVQGKGKSERTVFLSADARTALADYLERERPRDANPASAAVFLNARGLPARAPDGRLSPRAINHILACSGRWHDAELADPRRHIAPLRPHDLRHTFAFRLATVTHRGMAHAAGHDRGACTAWGRSKLIVNGASEMITQIPGYPVLFTVDYPDRELDRLTTFFRLIVAIPILVVIGAVSGTALRFNQASGTTEVLGSGGLLFLPTLLMILFRQKYPRWWFEWNLQLLRFSNRVVAYLALLDDRYPSTDEQQSVHLDFAYPDAREGLNRWLPLVKWLLAIPHYIVLAFLDIAAVVVVIIAWLAILVTGRYPRALFDFVVGVMRWHNRVVGYALVLVTDQYPPFRLSE